MRDVISMIVQDLDYADHIIPDRQSDALFASSNQVDERQLI